MYCIKNKTLIILDWDDTLFPTTWLLKNGVDLADPGLRIKYKNKLKKLDDLLDKFIKTMQSYGTVMIITNAAPSWVSLSGSLLRNTNKLLANIKVISARQQHNGIAQMKDWKKLSFAKEFKKCDKHDGLANIISIGDATYEYTALINLYNHQENYYDRLLKSVKFKRRPSYSELYDQLVVTNKNIDMICSHKNHLDLKMDEK